MGDYINQDERLYLSPRIYFDNGLYINGEIKNVNDLSLGG